MTYRLVVLIFVLTAIFRPVNCLSQSKAEKKILKKARKALTVGIYTEAKTQYQQLLSLNSSSQDYLFETGLAYYNSEVEREKSLEFFEKAIANAGIDTIPELLLYLGKANHYVHNFEKAIEFYNRFKKLVDEDGFGEILTFDVNHMIEMCNNGKQFSGEEDKKLQIKNLGENVNSIYGEYAPVVKKDGSLMLFTARREGSTGGKFYHDNKFFEDIYITMQDGDKWTRPTKIDSSSTYISTAINSKYHDAAIAYNDDETKLYIYRKDDVWESVLVDGKWSEPVRMNDNLNSKEHEPSVYISPDEKTLILVSNRKGGKGGRDLYMSTRLDDGSWGPVEPMGDEINTIYDDDAPFLTRDGSVLYFSSKGHNSIGGYDIFKSYKDDSGKWTAPINLGMPINTAGDDIYYIQNEEGTSAFYASNKAYGFGDMDLYQVFLECKSIPNTEIRGLVVAGDNQLPVGATIKVFDKETGDEMGTYNVDPITGTYLMVLPPEKSYRLEINAEGFDAPRAHFEEFTLPKQCEFFQLFQEIEIRKIRNEKNQLVAQEATFNNAFFDIKKQALEELGIVALPEDNPELVARVSEENMAITGTIMHNDLLPTRGVEIMLVDNNGDIIKTTRTDKNGTFQFYNLDPSEKYVVMIDEDDARISAYGDQPEVGNDFFVKGTINKMMIKERTILPLQATEVFLVNNEKKVINASTTDVSGSFMMDNNPIDKTRVNELADTEFPYNMDLDYPEGMFSTYIKTIDPENNEVNYSEFIDIIHFEQVGVDIPQFENILFDFDKYFLRQRSKEILERIYDFMAANPTVTIHMDGHTDWYGTEPYNVKLSERRSNSAFNYLIEKGIDPKRMGEAWHGEVKPSVPNANPDGSDNPDNRQLNRRVEFQINIPDMASITLTF